MWGRRLGVVQSALAKRLGDITVYGLPKGDHSDEDDHLVTAWPSTGVLLLLRAMGHIFPVTDFWH